MHRLRGLLYQLRERSAHRSVFMLSLSADVQVLVDQKDRDEHVVRLAGIMSDVFTFVDEAEPLKAIKAHVKTITLLIQQVTECGYFITEYTKQRNFCRSSFTSP